MVQEAKRIMDSRAFDYVIKVLMLLQSIAIGVLLPILMGMSGQISNNAIEISKLKSFLDHRLPDKFPPEDFQRDYHTRMERVEREVHILEIKILTHCAETGATSKFENGATRK